MIAAPPTAPNVGAVPPWRLKGHVIIACNCDYGCPCNFNGIPTRGKCEGNWNWHIDEGTFGDVSLSGLNLSMAVNWPGPIHDGNGEGIIVIDERADERQRRALSTLVGGQAGGPWKIIATTIGKAHGPVYASYEVAVNGYRSRVKAEGFVSVEMEPVRNKVTQAETHPKAILPEGFVLKEAELGASAHFRITGPVSFDHSGRYAAVGPFAYEGP
jgi:hypothetical protein